MDIRKTYVIIFFVGILTISFSSYNIGQTRLVVIVKLSLII